MSWLGPARLLRALAGVRRRAFEAEPALRPGQRRREAVPP